MAAKAAIFLLVILAGGACASEDAPWTDLWKARGKGGGTNQTIASLWGPLLMQTDNNTLIAFAEVDRSPTDHDGFMQLRRSHDGGASWEPAREVLGCGSPTGLYARTTNTLMLFYGRCSAPHFG